MENPIVLVDILNTLRHLESFLESQSRRLNSIEVSIHPSSGSAMLLPGFDNFNASLVANNKDLPDLPIASQIFSSLSIEDYRSNYEASLNSLFKRRFEFVDGSSVDERSEAETTAQEAHNGETIQLSTRPESPDTHLYVPAPLRRLNHQIASNVETAVMDHSDAYSMSVYSSRPLSRLSLNIPPVPPLPSANSPSPSLVVMKPSNTNSISNTVAVAQEMSDRCISNSTPSSTSARPSSILWTGSLRRSWSGRRTRSSSLSSSEKSIGRSHERAEMAFYAYGNFMGSLQSSISLKSRDRKSKQEETRRLKNLRATSRSSAESAVVSPSNRSSRGKDGLTRVYNAFSGILWKMGAPCNPRMVSNIG